MKVPVAVEAPLAATPVDAKDKKKSHKSRKDEHSDKSDSKSSSKSKSSKDVSKPEKRRDRSPSPVSRSKTKAPSSSPLPGASSGPESAHQSVVPKGDRSSQSQDLKKSSGSLFQSASSTPMAPPEQDTSLDFAGAGVCTFPQEQYEQVSDDDLDRSASGSGSEDGHFSDVADPPEQTEDMSYRETVRSVRAFMGWHHIPAFETDFSELDKSNNPWKGKNPRKPTRISVAMPPDDWLCQKLERLNLTVAEGYPSRSQDSAGLRRDQFIKVPKSQEKWYKIVNMTKSELVPKQVFNFVGYRFDLITGRVLPTQDRWETLQGKLRFMKDHHQCTVRQFMSLIGLLTATEKQVCASRLHMRPIQWHLKKHWHLPEVLEKVIPVPQSLHPHLDWWLDKANVLKGQPLHPLQHAVQLFTDASNEGWGAHLGDFTARGVWSPLEGRLHINFLEMKAVLLALRQLEHLCKDQIVLVATDNTTVVSYINKQGV